MFSFICSTLVVAGMAQVTAGWERMYFRKNSAQLRQPTSSAQGGSASDWKRRNSRPPWKGRFAITAIPRSLAKGSSRSSASLSSTL